MRKEREKETERFAYIRRLKQSRKAISQSSSIWKVQDHGGNRIQGMFAFWPVNGYPIAASSCGRKNKRTLKSLLYKDTNLDHEALCSGPTHFPVFTSSNHHVEGQKITIQTSGGPRHSDHGTQSLTLRNSMSSQMIIDAFIKSGDNLLHTSMESKYRK